MNILYYTTDKLCAFKGGTERTTITVASALSKDYGINCYSIFERIADTPKEDCIVEEFHWIPSSDSHENVEYIRSIIVMNNINCIIVQGAFIHVAIFRKAIKDLDCKLIFAHHFRPGWELVYNKFGHLFEDKPKSFKDYCRLFKQIIIYPFTISQRGQSLRESYKSAYDTSDYTILLSEKFIPLYCDFGKICDVSKFKVIPNALSYADNFEIDKLMEKHKVVLIVSRMDEEQKRISYALRIWKQISLHEESDGWKLLIVGDGPDLKKYKKIVSRQNIPNVDFLGRQNPLQYYRDAALFMMTSKSESWGLTLTEAQQMGCVPVAFNTYETLSDIIQDGINGVIVCNEDFMNQDFSGYCAKMILLMSNDELRLQMARNTIASRNIDYSKQVIDYWAEIILGS